jgi:hypothetical protein
MLVQMTVLVCKLISDNQGQIIELEYSGIRRAECGEYSEREKKET